MQPALRLSRQPESIYFPEQYQQQVQIHNIHFCCAKHKQKSF